LQTAILAEHGLLCQLEQLLQLFLGHALDRGDGIASRYWRRGLPQIDVAGTELPHKIRHCRRLLIHRRRATPENYINIWTTSHDLHVLIYLVIRHHIRGLGGAIWYLR
jgi:hypothetical protein